MWAFKAVGQIKWHIKPLDGLFFIVGCYVDGKRRKLRYDEFVVYGGALNAVMPAFVVTYTRETYSSAVSAQQI